MFGKTVNKSSSFFSVCIYSWKGISSWLSQRENSFFVLLIVIHLLPIWFFNYFPSQDGPAHLHSASVLRGYHFPEHSVFREYYLLNKNLTPNWFTHLSLAGLMYIVPPLIAQKLLLSGYIILLPISIRYALYAVRPDAIFLSFLAFPFIYNYVLHMGFYNFSYSMAMFFFVVGYWLKHQNHFTFRRVITLSVLSLLLYFCHLFSLVTAYIAIALLTVWLTILDLAPQVRQQKFNWRSFAQVLRMRVLVPLCAFLPTLILVVMFLARKSTVNSDIDTSRLTWKHIFYLLSLHSLVSFQKPEFLFSIALAGLFAAICLYVLIAKLAHRQINFWDGFLFVVVAYVLLYLIAPDKMSGGGNIKQRLLLYPFFILILWFGAQSYHWIVKQRIQLVAVGITLMLLGTHTIQYAELNSYLEEYVSGMHLVEPNTTLLPLSFSNTGHTPDGKVLSGRVKPFWHASGYIAAQKNVVVLNNYQAALDYFPIAYRSETSPFLHIGIENYPSKGDWGIEAEPPRVDFLNYPQRTGGHVDYVLIWQVLEGHRTLENTKSIFKQLEEGYDLIYTSPQRGLMQLYRRKDWSRKTGEVGSSEL